MQHARWLACLALAARVAHAAPEGAPACDRPCLRDVLARYLAAVIAHAPASAPLAPGHRATENGSPLAAGAGVWTSLSGIGTPAVTFADPASGQVAWYGELLEGTEPVIASLRVAVAGHLATEAEWTIARRSDGSMFSPDGLRNEPPPASRVLAPVDRAPRAAMVAAADAYFDGLQQHDGSRVPRIEGCERIENGVRVTHRGEAAPPIAGPNGTPVSPVSPGAATPGAAQENRGGDCTAGFEAFAHSIASTDLRRYPLVDEEAGVVMGMTLFHRPPGSPLRRNLLTEFFFERGGRIESIYAAMYYLDPAAADTSGWP